MLSEWYSRALRRERDPHNVVDRAVPSYLCTCSQSKLSQAPGPQASPFSLNGGGKTRTVREGAPTLAT